MERRGGDFPASKVAARYEAQPDDQKTVHYYLGGKEVAFKRGDTLYYVHQDHLGSSAVITNSASALVESMAYYPYGGTRTGSIATTEEQFTGQRLDSTGLYYYNARYYDPSIGRFISADTFGAKLGNPQSLNRYSYVLNNPLRYVDPSGHCALEDIDGTCPGASGKSASPGITTPSPDVPAPSAPVESAPSPTDNRLVAFGVGATVVLAADNVTGVGVVDDLLIPAIWLGIAVYSGVEAGKAIVSLTSESSSGDASDAAKQEGARTPGEKIKDFEDNPDDWELVAVSASPAKGDYKGGTSVDEVYRHRETGEIIGRHTIYGESGKVRHQHPRVP